MGTKVKVGRLEVTYFSAGELITPSEKVANLDEKEDRDLADHDRMRRILVRFLPGRPLACFYLHWSDGTDLHELDELVRSGAATEEHFSDALVGECHAMGCLNCKASLSVVTWAVALPVFPDDTRRAQEHTYEKRCPVCEEPWTASVLEVVAIRQRT